MHLSGNHVNRKGGKGGVLAGQFHTLLTYGDTPWGLMATLGSSYSMRGYYVNRKGGKVPGWY